MICSAVKEKAYIILGVIAEVYPEFMTPYAERLTGLYLGAMKVEVTYIQFSCLFKVTHFFIFLFLRKQTRVYVTHLLVY